MTEFKKIHFIGLLAFAVFFQGCNAFESATSQSSAVDPLLSTFSTIDRDIIQNKCATCHSGFAPSGNVDLSSYFNIISSGSVIARDPLNSSFYTEIINGEMPPPPQEPLTPEEIERVRTWIVSGALENELPTVSAGSDQNVVNSVSSVILNAEGSDVEGPIASYEWVQISGPIGLVLTGSNTSQLTITNLVLGSFTFAVTATDVFGDTATDNVNVNITEFVNQPPIANAGMDQSINLPLTTATLLAVATDSDGTIASYVWSQVSGPNVIILSGLNSASETASGLIEGVYVFEVTVVDNLGASATDQVQVTINPATPSFAALKTNIFDPKCARCHMNGESSGQYAMDTWTETTTRVVGGSPSTSPLYVRTANFTMPPQNAAEMDLTPQELADVNLWIQRGAPNN